ncbi:MAG: flavocytochrome c [Syntrophorhabdaceae bacterium]|nr:flavocytochrome c [Syntrophorhabdaceae bacterium]
MNRIWKIALLLGCVCLLLPAFSLQAAGTEAAGAELAGKTLLSDLHKDYQVGCKDCHGKTKDISLDDAESGVSGACVKCHGSSLRMAERSEEKAKGKEHINPHVSHVGNMNCTACHRGHEASASYCNNCHAFNLPMSGGNAAKKTPPGAAGKSNVHKIEQADIVIVGGGAAGMTAAIVATEMKAKVILVEKNPILGGNSMLAAGGMNAAWTEYQAAKGIADSPETMFQDTMKGGQNVGDPDLVRVLAYNSDAAVKWLTAHGANISDVGRMGGASANRAHRPVGGTTVGPHVTGVLKRSVADRKIETRLNCKVIRVLKNKEGRVTGVVVQGKHSGEYTIQAKAVVFATGGFSANADMVASLQPSLKGMTTSNQPGAVGEGMVLGEQAGAKLVDMKEIQIHPTVAAGSRILISESVRGNGAILVNREGKRFVNELTTRDKASEAVLKQAGGSAFIVFDEGILKSLKQIQGYFHLGLVLGGATPQELGAAIGAPGDVLAKTIEAYNGFVDAKKDDEFQRPDMPRALRTPNYYAIEIKPGIHYTMGGLKINTATQVIDEKGNPIPGFFAAGEATGGVHGVNRLGGNSVCETIVFGRIAGANAAKTAQGIEVVPEKIEPKEPQVEPKEEPKVEPKKAS